MCNKEISLTLKISFLESHLHMLPNKYLTILPFSLTYYQVYIWINIYNDTNFSFKKNSANNLYAKLQGLIEKYKMTLYYK